VQNASLGLGGLLEVPAPFRWFSWFGILCVRAAANRLARVSDTRLSGDVRGQQTGFEGVPCPARNWPKLRLRCVRRGGGGEPDRRPPERVGVRPSRETDERPPTPGATVRCGTLSSLFRERARPLQQTHLLHTAR
jgi:hypothetical protein